MVVLARLRTVKRIRRRRGSDAPSMVTQVNMLAVNSPEHLVVKQIARKLGISQSHLRTRFAASCGVSLGRHLRRLRLEKACGMLRLGNSRVSEVAECCNFNSIFSFSRAFHTAYGMSPLAYRKAAQPPRAPRRPNGKRPAKGSGAQV
jgi:AraC-like DNA-binding protein